MKISIIHADKIRRRIVVSYRTSITGALFFFFLRLILMSRFEVASVVIYRHVKRELWNLIYDTSVVN